jgi:NAD(P) transhydrogenase subunit alpha
MEAVFLTFILMLSIFLGFELINKVPATLHTPLMSGANAISGITVVGAVAPPAPGRGPISPTGSAPAPWPWPRSTWSAATW